MKYKPPSFVRGDCLSLQLEDGDYAAALVVDEKENHCTPDFGCSLVAVLNYKKAELPSLGDFKNTDVLSLTHSKWQGERVIYWMAPLTNREMKNSIINVGKIEIGDRMKRFNIDAIKAHGFWGNLFENLRLQKKFEAANS